MKKLSLTAILIAAMAASAFAQERLAPPATPGAPEQPPPRQTEPVRQQVEPVPAQPAPLQNAPASPTQAIQNAPGVEEKVEKQVYIYSSIGKRDPFLSIIIASKEAQKKKPKAKFALPIEDFDISQFKLIAIVVEKTEKYALVGLPDGKYYTVREGMKVGINDGKVTRILADGLIVREIVKDYRGKLAPKDTTLKLRTEEEQ